MRRRAVLLASIVALSTLVARAQSLPKVVVHKDPTCGCCSMWVTHLRKAGFTTSVIEERDMDAFMDAQKVPERARSCHTALVEGYVIEGHVPASDIKRLLAERPAVVGLAVPGMPMGSPGMEGAGGKPYNVVTFDKQGKTKVFSTQQPQERPR